MIATIKNSPAAVKERPILMNGAMSLATLNGSKTQTRRPYKVRFHPDFGCEMAASELVREPQHVIDRCCPYGQPGERLWVRETFAAILPQDPTYNGGEPIAYDYAATYKHGDRLGDSLGIKKRWTPSIHMPRAASRTLLEIVSVRVERLNDISEADAQAEGFHGPMTGTDWGGINQIGKRPSECYAELWEQINGPGSWAANPWVWCISFKRVKP